MLPPNIRVDWIPVTEGDPGIEDVNAPTAEELNSGDVLPCVQLLGGGRGHVLHAWATLGDRNPVHPNVRGEHLDLSGHLALLLYVYGADVGHRHLVSTVDTRHVQRLPDRPSTVLPQLSLAQRLEAQQKVADRFGQIPHGGSCGSTDLQDKRYRVRIRTHTTE